jgi:hypothetical protein
VAAVVGADMSLLQDLLLSGRIRNMLRAIQLAGVDMAKEQAAATTRERDLANPLPAPSTVKDGEWQKRISKARQARTETQELRRDKPPTFPSHHQTTL